MSNARRQSALEDLIEIATGSQIGAIIAAAIGFALAIDVPFAVLVSLTSDAPQHLKYGLPAAYESLAPIIRFFGGTLMVVSGISMVLRSKKPEFLKPIKSATAVRAIGAALLLLSIAALVSNCSGRALSGAPQPAPNQVDQTIQPDIPVSAPAVSATLPADKPFPANGLIERQLPLSGEVAQLTVLNKSRQNMIALFYYNVGKGDQEAARMYLAAGQSAMIDMPTFDYRLAGQFAPENRGLVLGFGPNNQPKDFGFIDLKTPANRFKVQPRILIRDYGLSSFTKGS